MKIKLKELFRKKEDDLDLDLDEELNDPDIRIETYEMTEDPQAKEELWDKIKKHQKFVHNRNAITHGTSVYPVVRAGDIFILPHRKHLSYLRPH